jgi:hypothetical protein
MILYRATTDPVARQGAHFTEHLEDAIAYTDNPGFGGPAVYSYRVSPRNALEVDDLEDLAGAYLDLLDEDQKWDWDYKLGEPPTAYGIFDYWKTAGYTRVFHVLESWDRGVPDVEDTLKDKYDWISYPDDFPAGSTTWKYIGKGSLKPDSKDPLHRRASARRVAARHMRAGTRLYHLSPVEFSNFKQQELGGGYQADIGFHFGTKDTALTASKMLAGKGRIKEGDTVYLYELDIDTGKSLVLNENRRGSWSINDLLRTIFEGGPGGGPVPAAGITDEEWNAYYGQDDDGEELDEGEGVFLADGTNLKDSWMGAEEQRRGFLSWLKAHGFKSVKYKNTYEGGGDSYIVFDPKQIKIKSVTPYTYEG